VRRPAVALVVTFAANGLAGAGFFARLPERQRALDLSDAGLGFTLLGLALGALIASPFAGRAVTRYGSRPVVVAAAVALGSTVWMLGAAPNPLLLFGALATFGAFDAAMDIAMNANGAAYERGAGRSVLHRLHATWSFGVLLAAGIAALAVEGGVSLTLQLAVVGATLALATVLVAPGLVSFDAPVVATGQEPRGARHFALPLLFLAIAAFGGAIIEGAPADWGAIRLERMGVSPSASALALAIFMAGMLAGRMVGDHLTDRFGGARVLRAGTLLVTCGTLLGVIVSEPWAFATGLALAGIGTSGVIPLAFSAAGRMPGVSPGFGAATVSLTARIGFLVEPALMGVTAELTSLRVAFLNVAVVGLVLAALAPRISPRGVPYEETERLHGLAGGA